MKHRFCHRLTWPLLGMLTCLLWTSGLRAELRIPHHEGLQEIGAGTLRWLGFHVYDASTWAKQDSLPTDGSVPKPFALQIIYARAIRASDLLDATETAWRGLSLFDAQAIRWLAALKRLWPDVKAGDSLVLHIDEHGRSLFYYNSRPLGGIEEPEFGSRFAAVWLHPDSDERELRRQLLGVTDK